MFDHSDISCRKFVHEVIPLLGNCLRTTQNEVPTLLAETAYCLKELYKTCDSMYDDILKLVIFKI